MATINDNIDTLQVPARVGLPDTSTVQSPVHVSQRPWPHGNGVGGHYKTTHRFSFANSQAANSRLFEFQNPSGTLKCVIDEIRIKWLQVGAQTAAIENSLDVFMATGFTAVDTTNTVTPVISVKRTLGMAAASAAVRGVTVAGAAAGMTGGTLTLLGSPLAQLPQWLLLALPTAAIFPPAELILAPGPHVEPMILAQNEGLVIRSRVALGVLATGSVYVELTWAEVKDF